MCLSIFKIVLQGAIPAEEAAVRRCYLFLISSPFSHFYPLAQGVVAEMYPYEMGNPFKKLCHGLPLF